MMRRIALVILAAGLSSAGVAGPQFQSEKLGIYPVYELSRTTLSENGQATRTVVNHHSFLAGLIDFERRPEWFKVRLGPILYQKRGSDHLVQPILFAGTDYMYDSEKGVVQPLVPIETDFAYTAQLIN